MTKITGHATPLETADRRFPAPKLPGEPAKSRDSSDGKALPHLPALPARKLSLWVNDVAGDGDDGITDAPDGPATSASESSEDRIYFVGERCLYQGRPGTAPFIAGAIRWIGRDPNSHDKRFGLELEEPRSHGEFQNGGGLFECKPGHGVLASAADLSPELTFEDLLRQELSLAPPKASTTVSSPL